MTIPDSAGLVIGPVPLYPALLDRIAAMEWRTLICAAIDAARILVVAGRPDIIDGTGIYALSSIDALPEVIAMAHRRIGEAGARGTQWLVFVDGKVEPIVRDALMALMLVRGTA